jgi:hypothetical protein
LSKILVRILACTAVVSSTQPFLSARPAAPQETREARWTQAELERVSDEIKTDVEGLRGLAFRRPVRVRLTDGRGFLEYARKRQEMSMTPGRVERDETIAKLLGLIPRDLDLVATFERFLGEQVGGFYDPSTDTFFLMDSFTGGIAKVILAHELTHALDDQHFDIDGTLEKLGEESDSEFAFHAVVEGSGTATMNRWTFEQLKNKTLDTADLMAASSLGSQGLSDAPPYIWKPLIAAYLRGEGFLTRTEGMNLAMKAATNDDVARAFSNPPRSSEQILHPEKYWDETKRDEPRRIRFDVAGKARGAVFGEFRTEESKHRDRLARIRCLRRLAGAAQERVAALDRLLERENDRHDRWIRRTRGVLGTAEFESQRARLDGRAASRAKAVDPEASGWKVLGEDTLGELVLALVATPASERKGFDAANPLAILGLRYTNAVAEGWGGDRALLLAKGDERCLDFVTVWDSLEDAREFETALQAVAREEHAASEILFDESVPSVELRICLEASVAEAGMPAVAWIAEPADTKRAPSGNAPPR